MVTLAARTGRAFELAEGHKLTVINTHGQQVVDTWVFAKSNPARVSSTDMTRMRNGHIGLHVGDLVVDSTRTPLLQVVSDTSPGVHDLLIPSCDENRYRELGAVGHDNCHDNFLAAVAGLGKLAPRVVPSPVNLFMNVPVSEDGTITIEPPVSVPGDAVTFRALEDVVVVLSACPQDIAVTNGLGAAPTDVEIVVDREVP